MASPFARAVADLKRLPRRMVERAADRFDQIAKASAARNTPTGRVKRHDRGGAVSNLELGTEETIRVTTGGGHAEAVAEVVGTPAGPWVWLEYGVKPHWIGAPGQLLGERLDHPVYGPVLHPGFAGRRAWSEAIRQFDAEVARTVDDITRGVA